MPLAIPAEVIRLKTGNMIRRLRGGTWASRMQAERPALFGWVD